MIACGTCKFWARGFDGTWGIGGHHTNGEVSECRVRAPLPRTPYDYSSQLNGDSAIPDDEG